MKKRSDEPKSDSEIVLDRIVTTWSAGLRPGGTALHNGDAAGREAGAPG